MEEQDLWGAQIAFLLTSRLINEEPCVSWISSVIQEHIFSEAPFGKENDYVQSGLKELQSWCDQSRNANTSTLTENLKIEWFMLFVGGGVPKAPCWESYYRETNKQMFGKRTLEVRSMYRRFGLRVASPLNTPDDHLGLMLGFLSRLIELELNAQEKVEDAAQILDAQDALGFQDTQYLQNAQEMLIVEHILPWLATWHFEVRLYARSGYYKGIADLTMGFCASFARRYGVQYDPDSHCFSYRSKSRR